MRLSLELLVTALAVLAAILASIQALVYKRDSRSAALWIVLIWILPAIGPLLFVFLGINRIRRRAQAMRGNFVRHRHQVTQPPCETHAESVFGAEAAHLCSFAVMMERVAERPLVSGNAFEPLPGGARAYTAMLDAIASAKESIALCTYIFDPRGIGQKFIAALEAAQRRGVEVRVLIDAVGARYSIPTAKKVFAQNGAIPFAQFNKPTLYWAPAFNLRNHRKILVIDGHIGFTGGFNIKRDYWDDTDPNSCSQDLHFRVEGPVVTQLNEVFADDWRLTTGENLDGPKWFPAIEPAGPAMARGIEAGPDETFERLRWALIGALNGARKKAVVMTPYFVPDSAILSALNAAALRGVQVDILLPDQCNLPFVRWASFAQLWQAMEGGCRVWLGGGPFDHSKLMIVDNVWTFIGSANWDARSLRLNFEFNVEVYDAALCQKLQPLIDSRFKLSRRITLEEVDARPLPIKIRDSAARLFAPYL